MRHASVSMPRSIRHGPASVIAIATLLWCAAPARADEASTIIERCTHGQSLSGFSQNGYREALSQMPTQVSEYSDCTSLIRNAQLAGLGGRGGLGSGGLPGGGASAVPIALTPAEQLEVNNAHRQGAAPVRIGGHEIRPGVVHANIASTTSTLPRSLLGILALALAGALMLAGGEAYKRVRARRSR